MRTVIDLIEKLKKDKISETIKDRMKEFYSFRKKSLEDIFRELVFCILTAGTSAELGIKTINHLGDTIFEGTQEDIQKKLKEVYRFHTLRAGYIYLAREAFSEIDFSSKTLREDLVKKIKGLGMKESSHFLRNVGLDDFAIIDFHIVDFLVKHKLIQPLRSKSLTPKKYLEIESILREISKRSKLSLGELDLYLWYFETGKVLK